MPVEVSKLWSKIVNVVGVLPTYKRELNVTFYRRIIMRVKLIYLISVVLVLGLVGNATGRYGDYKFSDAGADHLWTNPDNWNPNADWPPGPPNAIDDGANFNKAGTKCEIMDGMDALCRGFMIASGPVANEAEVSGGYLTCQWLNVGCGRQLGTKGYLTITGGLITVNGLFGIPHQFDLREPQLEMIQGHVDLYGGIVNTNNIALGDRSQKNGGGIGTMDITEGTLIVSGDKTAEIQAWIDKGWITAYGGGGEFELDYNWRYLDSTTLTAFLSENKAQLPNPENNAVDVQPEVTLSWSPGDNVQMLNGHDLYLGTNLDDVNDATRTDHPNVEYYNLGATSYGPLSLDFNKTYYWRVDELNDAHPNKMWKGYLWNFTIIEHLVVDDFESYDGSPLSGTWTASGSAISSVETSEIHGGSQAMSVGYDDSTSAVVTRGIAGEDWTKNGIEALYIWCKANSDAAQLSVKLNNSGSEQLISNIGQRSDWQRLIFDLSLFDVDLKSISSIAIEITAVTGGVGTVHIDDIALYPCIAGGLAADFNGDCVVDSKDFAVFGDSWLEEKYWP